MSSNQTFAHNPEGDQNRNRAFTLMMSFKNSQQSEQLASSNVSNPKESSKNSNVESNTTVNRGEIAMFFEDNQQEENKEEQKQ